MRRIHAIIIVVPLVYLFAGFSLGAESVTILNRTGSEIDLIQLSPAGGELWGDDLIPGRTVPAGGSAVVDLTGSPPWSFRFVDFQGTVYVIYEASPSVSGKIIVGPEHQVRISAYAGNRRRLRITNRTGMVVSDIRISRVDSELWGDDVLQGRGIRSGEAVSIDFDAPEGVLSFDVQFVLRKGTRRMSYVKTNVILTDGALLVLRRPQALQKRREDRESALVSEALRGGPPEDYRFVTCPATKKQVTSASG